MDIVLPALGENMDQGQVVSVAVAQGDRVDPGDVLLEIEAGKATLEIPAESAGTIQAIHVKQGDTIQVGAPVVTLALAGPDQQEDAQTKATSGAPSPPPSPTSPPDTAHEEAPEVASTDLPPSPSPAGPAAPDLPAAGPASSAEDRTTYAVTATPSVRKLARELGVDVHGIEGSGPGGRILADDVKRAVRALIATGKPAPQIVTAEGAAHDAFGPVRHEAMNGVRRVTAEHMAASWAAVPHVTHFDEADATALEDARKRLADQTGSKVSLTTLLVKLAGLALKVHPKLNARIDTERREIVFREYINIGVAVDTPRGLLVPVLRQVDEKDIQTLQQELVDKAEQARAGKLGQEDLRGSGFTVSNLGALGGRWFTPIVNAPEVAILGLGRTRPEPVYVDGTFVPKPMLPLSLSYDHRLIDGADAARFLRWLMDAMENPLLALLGGS